MKVTYIIVLQFSNGHIERLETASWLKQAFILLVSRANDKRVIKCIV